MALPVYRSPSAGGAARSPRVYRSPSYYAGAGTPGPSTDLDYAGSQRRFGRGPAGPVPLPAPARPATSGPPGAGGVFGSAGFQPAPLPAGSFNPEHEILSQESQRRVSQGEGDIRTARQRHTTHYWTRK